MFWVLFVVMSSFVSNLVSCFSQCLVASIGFERNFSVFEEKKKEKIVFYWFKMLILIIPFEVTSGHFCDIAFPSPGVFSVFFHLYKTFCYALLFVSRQFSTVGWWFFLKKKACFLTDMIFCNTSILKYRKENDIF